MFSSTQIFRRLFSCLNIKKPLTTILRSDHVSARVSIRKLFKANSVSINFRLKISSRFASTHRWISLSSLNDISLTGFKVFAFCLNKLISISFHNINSYFDTFFLKDKFPVIGEVGLMLGAEAAEGHGGVDAKGWEGVERESVADNDFALV